MGLGRFLSFLFVCTSLFGCELEIALVACILFTILDLICDVDGLSLALFGVLTGIDSSVWTSEV